MDRAGSGGHNMEGGGQGAMKGEGAGSGEMGMEKGHGAREGGARQGV